MVKLIHRQFELTPPETLGKIDLIIADPPDNLGLKYDGFKDHVSMEQYRTNITLWLKLMSDLTDGPIFFTFNEKWTRIVENAIEEIGLPIIQRLQWYFTFGQDQTSKGKYGLCYRPVYWLSSDYIQPERIKVPSARQAKYKDKRAAKGGKMPENVWQFPRICGTYKERRKWSPNQLPESLVDRIIKGHCIPGGRVLDPFTGSGTTAIICQRLGLNCVGIESSEATIRKTAEHLGVDYE